MDDLYLEKMKISERLQAVENTILMHTTEMKSWREQAQKLLDKHSEEIWGKDEISPGLKTNMDRLKQTEIRRNWYLGVIVTAVTGLLAKAGFDAFKN